MMFEDRDFSVGISFYTFQSSGYTIDVYLKRADCEKNFLTFATFVAFFPQLVAGPIERAKHLIPQLKNLKNPTVTQIKEGVFLVLWGYFLKVFIADNVSRVADSYFTVIREKFKYAFLNPPEVFSFSDSTMIMILDRLNLHLTSPEILLGMFAFALQIYGDFAGYSKIARGLSKFFGIELMVNFKNPYLSRNVSEFWQRWHISLSEWFRDYVYIPLGGNRFGTFRTLNNLMITMILAGLWHGAAWTFVIWGIYHGILLVGHRCFTLFVHSDSRNPFFKGLVSVSSKFITFVFVLYGWLIFRVQNLDHLKYFTQKLFTNFKLPPAAVLEEFYIHLFWTCSFGVIVFAADLIQYYRKSEYLFKFKTWWDIVWVGLLGFLIIFFGGKSETFIYFQF